MRLPKSVAAIVALATSALAGSAGASTFVPAAPLPFELVNLRMTVDSCAFNPDTVFVVNTGAAIQVRMRDNQCFAPGTPHDVDVRLGAYPVGLYNVEVTSLTGDIVTVRERLSFSVIPRVAIAVFPPPPFPLTDYTGLWWNPSQPGWGVSIHQSPMDTVFTALFEYSPGAPGQPTWYTLQSGRWASPTVWIGNDLPHDVPAAGGRGVG